MSDYFNLKSNIVSDISNVLSYDLTHTIGNFLHEIEPTEFVDKTRKKADVGDFVISRLRSYLKEFAVVEKKKGQQVFSTEYLVYEPKTEAISSNTLVAYCLTKQVQTILNYSQYGSAHPRFYEFIFNELPVPDSLLKINTGINALFKRAFELRTLSKQTYAEAERILLKEIGLQDFKPSQEPVNIKNFKEIFGTTKRLDAEYYQPKFEQLTGKIYATNQGKLLGELLDFNQRGKQPEYTDEDGLFVINSKHIRKNKIDFTENRKADVAATPKSLIIKKGDVLLNGTGVGTIGRCAAYLLTEPALPDNHVTILRTKTMNPVFLSVMLNSIIGQMQVDKFFKGSSGQIELYPTDINQFVVWDAPEDIQSKIANFVLNAYNLEAQSNQLLDVAKKAVEIAIEENEGKALQFIKNNSEHDRF